MEAIQSLRHIGFSEKEAKIYLALVQLGRSTAYSIAAKSGLKRPTTYLILEDLVKQGFVFEVPQAQKKLFEAKPPEGVFSLAKERIALAESALPSIQALARKQQGKTQALYFEGLSGLEQALIYRAGDQEGQEAVGFYAAAIDAAQDALQVAEAWLERCKRKNIRLRGFVPKDQFLSRYHNQDKEYGRDFKSLPREVYSSKVSIDTVCDFVRTIDIVSPIPQATIIENAEAAKTLREIFEMMWKKEGETKTP